jgi:hypothetical protein
MPRFIVRYRGSAPAQEITKRLQDAPSINVINDTGKMVLLDADEDELLKIVQPTSDVLIVPERHYEPPDRVPSVKSEPSSK